MNETSLSAVPRRSVLRGALIGGAIAATPLLGSMPAAANTPSTIADVTRLVVPYFRDKSRADVDATMSHFARSPFAYLDATLGYAFPTWQSLRDLFAQVMPTWTPQVKSYPVRILGDSTSALVFFVNTPGAFGPSEIRAAGVINFRNGKIIRQVDYWDGRHFGLANLHGAQVPPDQFPTDLRESIPGETAAPAMQHVARRLNTALASGNAGAAAELFADDAVFEDIPAHLQLIGPAAIRGYLERVGATLPYATASAAVRHTVGSARGGGYEWKSAGPVPRGITALELNRSGHITRLTALWDGSLADDQTLAELQRAAVEH